MIGPDARSASPYLEVSLQLPSADGLLYSQSSQSLDLLEVVPSTADAHSTGARLLK